MGPPYGGGGRPPNPPAPTTPGGWDQGVASTGGAPARRAGWGRGKPSLNNLYPAAGSNKGGGGGEFGLAARGPPHYLAGVWLSTPGWGWIQLPQGTPGTLGRERGGGGGFQEVWVGGGCRVGGWVAR